MPATCGQESVSAPSVISRPRSGSSRSTLRQALGLLEDEGVVRRVPGRGGGTFVSQSKIERDLSRIVGLPAMLRSQGVTAGTASCQRA